MSMNLRQTRLFWINSSILEIEEKQIVKNRSALNGAASYYGL
jgi:hypothetical protein